MMLLVFAIKIRLCMHIITYPEGDTQNRILRDTIISGLASDKTCAKVIKEDKDVTLPRVMEIA